MESIETSERIFISSVDLLNRTGLSRATLNNYIKMGILPHPIVKKPNDTIHSRAKRIGYFPDSVLGTLNRIKQYKKAGHSMAEIRQSFTRILTDPSGCTETKEAGATPAGVHSYDRGNEGGELFYQEENRSGDVAKNKPILKDEDVVSISEKSTTQDLLKRNMPIPLSFSVLAADLQDPIRICAEMEPEEYLKLINQIWISVRSSFKKYFGVYGKHVRNGVVYYFLNGYNSNYLMNPISCALELREKVKKLSNEWKQYNGWVRDLYLNIGISEGHEYFGKIYAAPTVEFITLGDTANYALRLSDFGRCGSIWTTKNLLMRLDEQERKRIRYGIRPGHTKSDTLIENTFSRIADLIMHDRDKQLLFSDISTITVTEIHNLY